MYPENLDVNVGWSDGLHHNMEYVAYKAVEFIEDNQEKDWFLYVNPTAPHGPDVLDAFDVDCRITVDGDFTSNITGWSVIGMTAEHGDDCNAYRDDVKARAGTSTSNSDLGAICEWVSYFVLYDAWLDHDFSHVLLFLHFSSCSKCYTT